MADILKHEQTSTGPYPMNYILEPRSGAEWLIVVFSAFAPDHSANQHLYNFLNVLQDVPAHKLYIQDTYGKRGVYYLCHQLDFGVSQAVTDLIRSVQAQLGCDNGHTISLGSSKGGSAALYFGLGLGLSHVLAMVPQFRIGTYLNTVSKRPVLEDMVGKEDPDGGAAMLDTLLEKALEEGRGTVLHILTSHHDEQYQSQIVPFLAALERTTDPARQDICFDDRIKSHNGAANRNGDFVRRKLLEILFGCRVTEAGGVQTVSRDDSGSSHCQVTYSYEKTDGTQGQCHLTDQSVSFPVEELNYSELTVEEKGRVLYRECLCDYLADRVRVSCGWDCGGLRVEFVPVRPTPLEYSFYVQNSAGEIVYRQPYSSKTIFRVSDLSISSGVIQHFIRYKAYIHWDKLSFAAPEEPAPTSEEPVDIGQLSYTLSCRDKTLFFSLDVQARPGVQFAYYVRRDGAVIHKTGYGSQTQLQFPLEEPGSYCVSYFVRQNGAAQSKESRQLYYQPCQAAWYGPEGLGALLERCSICKAPLQESAFVVADLLGLALEHLPSVFPGGDAPCETAVSTARAALEEILSPFQGRRVFLVQWRLWPQAQALRGLHWVLEELYDCARTTLGRWLWELPVSLPAGLWREGMAPEGLYDLCRAQLLAALEQIPSLVVQCELHQAQVRAEVTDGRLTAVVDHPGRKAADRCCFYLFRDGALVERTPWGEAMELERTVEESGVYMVQAYLKRGDFLVSRKSAPVSCHTQAEREAFDRFLNEANEVDVSAPLPFYAAKPPFCDVCLVTRTDGWQGELKVLPQVALLQGKAGQTSIYSNGRPAALSDGSSLLLSGSVVIDGKLRVGMEELPRELTGAALADQTGQYTCAVWRGEELRLSTDFFCFKHWYYYQDESGFVASNSYHLMLLALRELGLPLSLDTQKACVTLAGNVQTLTQNFTRHMDVAGVFQLAPEQRLVLRDGTWSVECSQLGEIFSHTAPYHEEDYQALLDQAAGELVDNCRRILSDAHYEDISVDLSGGLDSRIVYSAMTNLPESAGRIKISTRDTPGSQDLPIALSINQLYSYPYDDFPTERYSLPPKAMDEMHRSFYLGVFYSYAPISSVRPENKRVSVTGGLGDAIARPHMGLHRRYLTSPMAHLSTAETFTEEFRRELGPNLVLGGQEAARAFVSYLSRELEDMGQWDYFKGLNHIYLAYRNSYHFYGLAPILGHHVAFPIQSKALLRLSDMVFSVHRSIRMTLDLIYRLNPVAASFPYDSQEDREELERLRPELTMDPCFRMLRMDLAPDRKPWEEANKRRKAGERSIPAPQPMDSARHDMGMASLLCAFRSLMVRYPDLCSAVGLDLYHLFTATGMSDRQAVYWRNKLFSLLDQSNLCFPGEEKH